jgi:hypothetical protein
VIAQLVEVDFSLQMAHTLMHCLLLDDFLDQYDPSAISASLKRPRGGESRRRKAILSPAAPDEDAYRAIDDSYGGKVFSVDRRFMYSDLSGGDPEVFAIIDPGFQRVIPRYNPYEFYDHRDPTWDSPNRVLASSLLIEDDFLYEYYGEPSSERVRKRREHFELFRKQMPEGVDWQINGLDRLLFRNLCVINLTVGLTSFVRNLLGLPNKHDPFEEKGD